MTGRIMYTYDRDWESCPHDFQVSEHRFMVVNIFDDRPEQNQTQKIIVFTPETLQQHEEEIIRKCFKARAENLGMTVEEFLENLRIKLDFQCVTKTTKDKL